MNHLKITALSVLLWLSGCATQSPAPTTLLDAVDGTGIVLAPSPELRTPKPASATVQADIPTNAAVATRPLPPVTEATVLSPLGEQSTGARNVMPQTPPADIWERIRRGYSMPDLTNDLVRDREQWYSVRPDYLMRMTERSRRYLFYIVEELEVRNMPAELALLPFIESAFNPQAISSAKASGIWQFMPATGKYFSLKQSVFRDDRRDVLASTRAALDYLQKLYGMFGDWHLALAAYNWGEGNLGRAIAKNKKAGLPTGYQDLSAIMPLETRMYVPKLQAMKNIVANPTAFNATLPLIENHPYFQTVPIHRDIDITLAAKLAEVPLDVFKALNPSLNKPVILANGTPQILLPWDNAATFQSNLDGFSGARLASWTVWVAPKAMRPADIAKKVGMREAEFRALNNIPARMMIKAGSALLVPRGSHVDHNVATAVADNGQVSLAPEVVLKRITVKAVKGDTVASIARKHKVSATNVAQWNNVGMNASFAAKQTVVLYVPAKAGKKSKAKKANPSKKK